ncbi:MAG: hypothetical protein ACI8VE_003091 [Natrialbaceae archaeon]|jgi:hypothetical protein
MTDDPQSAIRHLPEEAEAENRDWHAELRQQPQPGDDGGNDDQHADGEFDGDPEQRDEDQNGDQGQHQERWVTECN